MHQLVKNLVRIMRNRNQYVTGNILFSSFHPCYYRRLDTEYIAQSSYFLLEGVDHA